MNPTSDSDKLIAKTVGSDPLFQLYPAATSSMLMINELVAGLDKQDQNPKESFECEYQVHDESIPMSIEDRILENTGFDRNSINLHAAWSSAYEALRRTHSYVVPQADLDITPASKLELLQKCLASIETLKETSTDGNEILLSSLLNYFNAELDVAEGEESTPSALLLSTLDLIGATLAAASKNSAISTMELLKALQLTVKKLVKLATKFKESTDESIRPFSTKLVETSVRIVLLIKQPSMLLQFAESLVKARMFDTSYLPKSLDLANLGSEDAPFIPIIFGKEKPVANLKFLSDNTAVVTEKEVLDTDGTNLVMSREGGGATAYFFLRSPLVVAKDALPVIVKEYDIIPTYTDHSNLFPFLGEMWYKYYNECGKFSSSTECNHESLTFSLETDDNLQNCKADNLLKALPRSEYRKSYQTTLGNGNDRICTACSFKYIGSKAGVTQKLIIFNIHGKPESRGYNIIEKTIVLTVNGKIRDGHVGEGEGEFYKAIVLGNCIMFFNQKMYYILADLETGEVLSEGKAPSNIRGIDAYRTKVMNVHNKELLETDFSIFSHYDSFLQLYFEPLLAAKADNQEASSFLGLIPKEDSFNEDTLSHSDEMVKEISTDPAPKKSEAGEHIDLQVADERSSTGVAPATQNAPHITQLGIDKIKFSNEDLSSLFYFLRQVAYSAFSASLVDVSSKLDRLLTVPGSIEVSPVFFSSLISLMEVINSSIDNPKVVPALNLLCFYLLEVHLARAAQIQSASNRTLRVITSPDMLTLAGMIDRLPLPTETSRQQTIAILKANILGQLSIIGLEFNPSITLQAVSLWINDKIMIERHTLKAWLESALFHPKHPNVGSNIRNANLVQFFEKLASQIKTSLKLDSGALEWLIRMEKFEDNLPSKLLAHNVQTVMHFLEANIARFDRAAVIEMALTCIPAWKDSIKCLKSLRISRDRMSYECYKEMSVFFGNTTLACFYFWFITISKYDLLPKKGLKESIKLETDEMSEAVVVNASEAIYIFCWETNQDPKIQHKVDFAKVANQEILYSAIDVPAWANRVCLVDEFRPVFRALDVYRLCPETGEWMKVCPLDKIYDVNPNERIRIVANTLINRFEDRPLNVEFQKYEVRSSGLSPFVLCSLKIVEEKISELFQKLASSFTETGLICLAKLFDEKDCEVIPIDEFKSLLSIHEQIGGVNLQQWTTIFSDDTSPEVPGAVPVIPEASKSQRTTVSKFLVKVVLHAKDTHRSTFEASVTRISTNLKVFLEYCANLFSETSQNCSLASHLLAECIKPTQEKLLRIAYLMMEALPKFSSTFDQVQTHLKTIGTALGTTLLKRTDNELENNKYLDPEQGNNQQEWHPKYLKALVACQTVLAKLGVFKLNIERIKKLKFASDNSMEHTRFSALQSKLIHLGVKSGAKLDNDQLKKLLNTLFTDVNLVLVENQQLQKSVESMPGSSLKLGNSKPIEAMLRAGITKLNIQTQDTSVVSPYDFSVFGGSKTQQESLFIYSFQCVRERTETSQNLASTLAYLRETLALILTLTRQITDSSIAKLILGYFNSGLLQTALTFSDDFLLSTVLDIQKHLIVTSHQQSLSEPDINMELIKHTSPASLEFSGIRLPKGYPNWLMRSMLESLDASMPLFNVVSILQPERSTESIPENITVPIDDDKFETVVRMDNSPEGLITKMRLIRLLERMEGKSELIAKIKSSIPKLRGAPSCGAIEEHDIARRLDDRMSKIESIQNIKELKGNKKGEKIESKFDHFKSKLYNRIKRVSPNQSVPQPSMSLLKVPSDNSVEFSGHIADSAKKSLRDHARIPVSLLQLVSLSLNLAPKEDPQENVPPDAIPTSVAAQAPQSNPEDMVTQSPDTLLSAIKRGVLGNVLLDLNANIPSSCRVRVRVSESDTTPDVDLSAFGSWICISDGKKWVLNDTKNMEHANIKALTTLNAGEASSLTLKPVTQSTDQPPGELVESTKEFVVVPCVYSLSTDELLKLELKIGSPEISTKICSTIKLLPQALKVLKRWRKHSYIPEAIKEVLQLLFQIRKKWTSSDTQTKKSTSLSEASLLEPSGFYIKSGKQKYVMPAMTRYKSTAFYKTGIEVGADDRVFLKQPVRLTERVTDKVWHDRMDEIAELLYNELPFKGSTWKLKIQPLYQFGVILGIAMLADRKLSIGNASNDFWKLVVDPNPGVLRSFAKSVHEDWSAISRLLVLTPDQIKTLRSADSGFLQNYTFGESFFSRPKELYEEILKQIEESYQRMFFAIRQGIVDIIGGRVFNALTLSSYLHRFGCYESDDTLDMEIGEVGGPVLELVDLADHPHFAEIMDEITDLSEANLFYLNQTKKDPESNLTPGPAPAPATAAAAADKVAAEEEDDNVSLGGLFD